MASLSKGELVHLDILQYHHVWVMSMSTFSKDVTNDVSLEGIRMERIL